ncbi:hypothetical protein [Lachnospira sp.]|jgi:hypothetical protein|uniref:hypothetical protein n=1 Tax=Lachnospira sp. TaxID=2049031 RepID=UPI00257EE3BC|nr:hypothetical protein [Lachnospira sp.]
MRFYKKLYYGEEARKNKAKIFSKIKRNSFSSDTYLITLASNPENLLDIISANVFNQPHFKKQKNHEDILVVGIAKGEAESYELVRQIIDEMYKKQGDFNIREFLEIKG